MALGQWVKKMIASAWSMKSGIVALAGPAVINHMEYSIETADGGRFGVEVGLGVRVGVKVRVAEPLSVILSIDRKPSPRRSMKSRGQDSSNGSTKTVSDFS